MGHFSRSAAPTMGAPGVLRIRTGHKNLAFANERNMVEIECRENSTFCWNYGTLQLQTLRAAATPFGFPKLCLGDLSIRILFSTIPSRLSCFVALL